MSIELWEQGVIIEFSNNTPCHRAMVRTVGKVEIVLVDIENGNVSKLTREELGAIYALGNIKFLAESRDFGDLKFIDLSEKAVWLEEMASVVRIQTIGESA